MEPARVRESDISKRLVADIFSDRAWIDVYSVLQTGLERRAFSSATVESFLRRAFAGKDIRPQVLNWLVSERSWKRRKQGRSALSPAEVARIASVGRVIREARRLWPEPGHGTAEKFLVTAHPRLRGESPIQVAASDGGLPAVLELLARIEEGAPV